jgi:accessory gene regulator protein AgrB
MQTDRRREHPGRTLLVLFGATGLLLVALGIATVVVPAAAGVILLGALVADVTLGVVMFAVQRRRHW